MSDAYKLYIEIQNKAKEQQKYKNYENEDFIEEITELQEENLQLKEVIEEVRDWISPIITIEKARPFYEGIKRADINELLQILDKVKD